MLARTRVAGSWGFAVPSLDAVAFHFVAEGRAFVRQSGAKTMELRTSEMVMFPRGCAHELAHSARGKVMPLETFVSQRNGVVDCNRKATTLICGQFNMDMHLALPALRALPEVVSLRAGTEPGRSPLSDTLRLLRDEVETANFGNRSWCVICSHRYSSTSCVIGQMLFLPQRPNGFRLFVRRIWRGFSRKCMRPPTARGL